MPDDSAPRLDPLAPAERGRAANGRRIPTPRRKKPGPYRVPPREQRHGLLIVNTGDGKGKTTAAVGLMLRAVGRGMSVGMYQFIKSDRVREHGEHQAAQLLGVDITPLGQGCTVGADDVTDDRALAVLGWERCAAALASGEFDVLILDELTFPLAWGWLDTTEVIHALRARPAGTHVVVTGRHAPLELIEAADLVTEMRVIKHPLREQRIGAQAGIDV